jgi:predicted transcriptional regulator
MTEPSEAIISIRPSHARAILKGSKTVELRRRIPPIVCGTRLWIYATRPLGAIVGTAMVDDIERGRPGDIWDIYHTEVGVSLAEFETYFDDTDEAIAIVLKSVQSGTPVDIAQLRAMRNGFHPPQVMVRISSTEARSLRQMTKVA